RLASFGLAGFGRRFGTFGRFARGLGRQWLGIVGQRVEIIDHVGALLWARQAGKRHRGPGNVSARVRQKVVQLRDRPIAALGLHGRRIVEPRLDFGPADDAPQVRADFVWAALLERVAGLTDLGDGFAALRVRARKQLPKRFLRGGGRRTAPFRLFRNRALVPWL